ncbi:MAG: DNA-directed DNA polymerase [Candidatus Woesearchaeota archaeon]|nr:DNA-directed DNA polymerase [Candidatus Woesearchaeota archaeon]
MKIQFYPIDVLSKSKGDRTGILLYGKTDKGERNLVVIREFKPYFWALLKDDKADKQSLFEKLKAIKVQGEDNRTISVSKIEIHRKKFLGCDFDSAKVFTELPSDVPELRIAAKSLGFEIYEADIPFSRRFMVDTDIIPMALYELEGEYSEKRARVPVFNATAMQRVSEELLPNPRVLAFDIETYSPFGKISIPESDPIIMCGFYSDDFKKVITWGKFKSSLPYIEFVASEKSLIERFKSVINEYKPDILVGYYSDGFDLPYIKKRADFNKVELNIGLDGSSLVIKRGRVSSARIVGIPHLDIYRLIKNIIARSLETSSLSLDAVSNELLDERKDEVDIESLSSIWDNEPEKLEKYCQYNLKDADLTFHLFHKTSSILFELTKIVRLNLYDVSRMSLSQIVEWYLIREAKSFNEIVPNKPTNEQIIERKIQTYKGAFVFEPSPGLYKDIVVFDFRSLYPSIIVTHNISPDTIGCSCCKDDKDSIPELESWFCKKKKGFISTVIGDVIARRMRVKEIMKTADEKDRKLLKAREQALKTIANSMYGYMGFFNARWYSIESTRSITAYERHYIKKVIDEVDAAGFKVLYSDTDSVFLALGNKTRKDAENFLQQVNRELPGLMELELEDFYPSGIFVSAKIGSSGAKKKYALLSEKGTIKIRGFETVRRNFSFIGKEVQENILNIILRENDSKKAFDYVIKTIEQLRKKEIPIEKLVIITQLQKNTEDYDSIGPHVAVAQRMKELGKPVGIGTMIRYIVTEGKGRIRDRAKLPEETKDGEYDAEYYIKNQIIPSVGKIFEVLGYKEEELLGKSEEEKAQSSLHSFFKK